MDGMFCQEDMCSVFQMTGVQVVPHDDCIPLHIPAAGQDRPRPHQGPEFSGNGWGQLSPDSALHTLAPDLSVWL